MEVSKVTPLIPVLVELGGHGDCLCFFDVVKQVVHFREPLTDVDLEVVRKAVIAAFRKGKVKHPPVPNEGFQKMDPRAFQQMG